MTCVYCVFAVGQLPGLLYDSQRSVPEQENCSFFLFCFFLSGTHVCLVIAVEFRLREFCTVSVEDRDRGVYCCLGIYRCAETETVSECSGHGELPENE